MRRRPSWIDSLTKYKDLMDQGYDDKFKVYERYTKEQIPAQINSFMASDKVDKCFTDVPSSLCAPAAPADHYNACPGLHAQHRTRRLQDWCGNQLDMDECPKIEWELETLDRRQCPNLHISILAEPRGLLRRHCRDMWGIEQTCGSPSGKGRHKGKQWLLRAVRRRGRP